MKTRFLTNLCGKETKHLDLGKRSCNLSFRLPLEHLTPQRLLGTICVCIYIYICSYNLSHELKHNDILKYVIYSSTRVYTQICWCNEIHQKSLACLPKKCKNTWSKMGFYDI